MNETAIALSGGKAVQITHNGSSTVYTYLTLFDHKPGDLVVVENIHGFAVGRVKSMAEADPNATYKYRWVVSPVDLSVHAAIQKRLGR